MHLINAFSVNMLPSGFTGHVSITPVAAADAAAMIASGTLTSAIGHEDLARLLDVPCARLTLTLGDGDTALLAQYRGPRLPAGATELPAGAAIEFYSIKIVGKEEN